MDELVIVQKKGACVAEVDEGRYVLRYTPAFAAETPKKGEQDVRVETLCDVATALFREINRIERLSKGYGIDPNDIYDFGLQNILPVLMVNAVMHGNRYDPSKTVSVSYEHTEAIVAHGSGTISFTVSDWGAGFDYRHLQDAWRCSRTTLHKTYNECRRPEDTPPHSLGRGLFELLWYATRVKWNESGNEITVTKRLRPLRSMA